MSTHPISVGYDMIQHAAYMHCITYLCIKTSFIYRTKYSVPDSLLVVNGTASDLGRVPRYSYDELKDHSVSKNRFDGTKACDKHLEIRSSALEARADQTDPMRFS
ncbi:hypothetical protein TMEN_9781 [Trichophyton mentagrophytes]|nr:hypothetical protein TMEN_9781 [Trichophyton mentagrophytes]